MKDGVAFFSFLTILIGAVAVLVDSTPLLAIACACLLWAFVIYYYTDDDTEEEGYYNE